MVSLNREFQKTNLTDSLSAGRRAHKILLIFLLLSCLLSIAIGPVNVSLWAVLHKLVTGQQLNTLEHVIFWDIRLPRLVMGICVGAALGVSGAVMQGLFRNPLADPGLIGVGAGASLGAIIAIVMGGALPNFIISIFGNLSGYFCSFPRWLAFHTSPLPTCYSPRANLYCNDAFGRHCSCSIGGGDIWRSSLHCR